MTENGKSRLKQLRLFCLEHAYYVSADSNQCEKAHPCHTEHEGAAILLLVGNDRLTNHNHERLPRFGPRILDPFSYPKNEHSFPHCTNLSLLERTTALILRRNLALVPAA